MSKTHLVWSCAHACPSADNERFEWLGKFIYDLKPDMCIDLGDGADMRSLNMYDKAKPGNVVLESYERDIDVYNDSQEKLRHQFRYHRRKKPTWIGFEGNHECFQGHTEIFVKDKGWVQTPNITEGDMVMSLSGSWEPVKATHKLWHEGPMYSYKNQVGSFTVTPNHRVYYYTCNGNLLVKPAKDTPRFLDLPVATQGVDEESSCLTDAQVKFNAIALTDSYHKKGKLVLYQSGPKAKEVEQIIKDCKVEYRKVERDRDIKSICGVELKTCQVAYEFHMKKPFWCVNQNKSIPSKFFNIPTDQADIFLDMLVFCDGSPMPDRNSSVFYGKKKICDDVQAFCQVNGRRASITEYRSNQFRVNINPRVKQRFEKVLEDEVKDWVYCITVESGSFLARQGGLSLFTGNCRIKTALSVDPRLEGSRYGISFSHLQTKTHFDEYHEYENSAPAIANYGGVDYAHFFAPGNSSRAVSGIHHAYGLIQARAVSSTCGHSHLRSSYFKDGAGANGLVASVVGCYKGKAESWAGQANRSWWKGVLVKREVENGMYEPQWISMDTLKKEYS